MRYCGLSRLRFISSLTLAALAGILLAPRAVHAQTPVPNPPAASVSLPDEMMRLRPFLGADNHTKIQMVGAAVDATPLFTYFPIKVFVSTGLDLDTRDNFVRWASEWQKKDAKKYGELELVGEAGKADLILVRYTLADRAVQKSETKTFPLAKTTTYDRQDRADNSTSYGTTTSYRIEQRVVNTAVAPTFSYIVARNSDGFSVLKRSETVSKIGGEKDAGKPLWDAVKKLLKADTKPTK